MLRRPAYSREQAEAAVSDSRSFSEALRKLGRRAAGGNHRTLRRHLAEWGISTAHFDPNAGRRRGSERRVTPLSEILVEGSSFSRGHLKERLYAAGLKTPRCELCGQGPEWRGRRMALVLDHVNGVPDDNRIENLRIVCPNCAATLDTHCGRNTSFREARPCAGCGARFLPGTRSQRFCSRRCAARRPRPEQRKVARPDLRRLEEEVAEFGFRRIGRRYGVSDNAVRKWLRQAEPPRRHR